MLQVSGLEAGYGASQILFGVSMAVGRGEAVSLLGRNGMGKTTTIRSIMGLTPVRGGEITFEGAPIQRLPSYRIAKIGIGLVPEGRRIFPNLTVRENLVASAANRSHASAPWTLERVLHLFPRLKERLNNMGNHLSGGEQQMLAIGRALMTNPKLLLLDEVTEGLAPLVREEIWQCLDRLRSIGQSILIIDKNVAHLMRLCDRHYMLEKGQVVWHGDTADLLRNEEARSKYLSV